MGNCKRSTDHNLPQCIATQKSKKLPRHLPMPHEAPNQAAFSLQNDWLFTVRFFLAVRCGSVRFNRTAQHRTNSNTIFFTFSPRDADRSSSAYCFLLVQISLVQQKTVQYCSPFEQKDISASTCTASWWTIRGGEGPRQ